MDIPKWLAETDAASRPTKPLPAVSFMPTRPAIPAARTENKIARQRMRATADSSILALEDAPTFPHSGRPASRQAHRKSSQVLSEDRPRAPSSYVDSRKSVDSEPYSRKKRRKTRADKYELKNDRHIKAKRGHAPPRSGKRKQKTGGTKTGRSCKINDQANVIHTFRASNVEGDRLTLQPANNFGLFKKGAASVPFRGDGSVPDLAFSEIRFLQKHAVHSESVAPMRRDKAMGPRDRARQTEEEVSAYFVPTRSALVEKSNNTPSLSQLQPLYKNKQQRNDEPYRHASVGNSDSNIDVQPKPIRKDAGTACSKSTPASGLSWPLSTQPQPIDVAVSQAGSKTAYSNKLQDQSFQIDGRAERILRENDKCTRPVHEGPRSRTIAPALNADKESCHLSTFRRERRASAATVNRQHKAKCQHISSQTDLGTRPETTQDSDSLPLPSSPPKAKILRPNGTPLEARVARSDSGSQGFARNDHQKRNFDASSPLGILLSRCGKAVAAAAPNRASQVQQDISDHDRTANERSCANDDHAVAQESTRRPFIDNRRIWLRANGQSNTNQRQYPTEDFWNTYDDKVYFCKGSPRSSSDENVGPNLVAQGAAGVEYGEDDTEGYEETSANHEHGLSGDMEHEQIQFGVVEPKERDVFARFWRPNILY